MRWEDTEAAECRYGDIAGEIWGDWEIIWENSEADYQGSASFIAYKDGTYVYYEWDYGSCSGCDTWEAANYTDEQIEKEMRRDAVEYHSMRDLVSWVRSAEKFQEGKDGIELLVAKIVMIQCYEH